MPAPRLHENIIADQIVSLIDQALSTVLGLKIVTVGALELYPALEQIEDNVPAVFVKPAPSTALARITTGQTYTWWVGVVSSNGTEFWSAGQTFSLAAF